MHAHCLMTAMLIIAATIAFGSGRLLGSEPATLDANQFARLHAMLKPQTGESRWMEVEWYPSVWEVRKKAAAAGKPIFFWAGSGGAPVAGC